MSSTVPESSRALPTLGEIQAPVREGLAQVKAHLRRIIAEDIPLVLEVNDHLMGMKGKLFRPTLVLLANAADGESSARAVPLASAIELLHLATLVHDDAVDHSVLRRGMPTVNALFSHQISIIMGDYMYARSLRELVNREEFDALRVIAEASNAMTIGEIRQLAVYDALSFSEQDYYLLIRTKTASLISAACELGALAGAPRHREALRGYGEWLGMAFQVADDLLDYTADALETGKPAGLDLHEHKVTLPLIAALRSMSPAARERVERLFSTAEPSEAAIAEVVSIVSESGGLEYARRKGEEFAEGAEEALRGLPDSPARAALTDAIGYVMDRRS